MKKIITLMSAILVLGAVATASTTVNNEIFVKINKTEKVSVSEVMRGRCDPIERLLDMCRNSQTLPFEN